jgi:hypothetical protein
MILAFKAVYYAVGTTLWWEQAGENQEGWMVPTAPTLENRAPSLVNTPPRVMPGVVK